jgi:hypothetical protein
MKGRGGMKPVVILEMLQNPCGDLLLGGLELGEMFPQVSFAESGLAVRNAEPVRERQPGQKVRSIQMPDGVGEVVHRENPARRNNRS